MRLRGELTGDPRAGVYFKLRDVPAAIQAGVADALAPAATPPSPDPPESSASVWAAALDGRVIDTAMAGVRAYNTAHPDKPLAVRLRVWGASWRRRGRSSLAASPSRASCRLSIASR